MKSQEQFELEFVREMSYGLGAITKLALLNEGTGPAYFVFNWIERELQGKRVLRSNKRLVAMKKIQENGGCLELEDADIKFHMYLSLGVLREQINAEALQQWMEK